MKERKCNLNTTRLNQAMRHQQLKKNEEQRGSGGKEDPKNKCKKETL